MRNGPGSDDKQHAFILFGDADSLLVCCRRQNHKDTKLMCSPTKDMKERDGFCTERELGRSVHDIQLL